MIFLANNKNDYDEENKSTEIPEWRKGMYYGGMILSGIGLLMFLSTFFSIANGDPFNRTGNPFLFAFIGIVLVGIGQKISIIGKKGTAGSGLKLDPKAARKDLEPFTRAGGAMIADAYYEFKSENKAVDNTVIKIRCKNCGELNDKNANYCDNCGEKL